MTVYKSYRIDSYTYYGSLHQSKGEMPGSSGGIGSVPVTDAVAKIILRNYVVLEALKLKIVNYHALASKIASEVQDETGREANMETIVVAIKRFSDSLQETKMEGTTTVLKGAKLNLTGGIVDLTITSKGVPVAQILQVVLKLVSKFTGASNVFQLPNSVKVVAEEDDAQILAKALPKEYAPIARKNVARITIRLSPTAEKVPGVASFITDLLYRNGVSILDAFLSYEDVVLIVQEKFGPKAYQVLSEEMSG